MHLSRSDQVPRRAKRGALRSKVARGCGEPEGPARGRARSVLKKIRFCPTNAFKDGAMETSAILSSVGSYSLFSAGGDTIRFATSPRLLRYTRIKRWEDGYLEVGADYGHGEVEDYIDIRQILDNLYYDTDSFLKGIKKVEVRYE